MALTEHTSRTGVWLSDSPRSFSCVFQKSRQRKHVIGCELLGSRSTLSCMKVRESFPSFFTTRINSGWIMWTSAFWVIALMRCGFCFLPPSTLAIVSSSGHIWKWEPSCSHSTSCFHFLLPPADSHPTLHFLSSVCPDWLCRVACSSLF